MVMQVQFQSPRGSGSSDPLNDPFGDDARALFDDPLGTEIPRSVDALTAQQDRVNDPFADDPQGTSAAQSTPADSGFTIPPANTLPAPAKDADGEPARLPPNLLGPAMGNSGTTLSEDSLQIPDSSPTIPSANDTSQPPLERQNDDVISGQAAPPQNFQLENPVESILNEEENPFNRGDREDDENSPSLSDRAGTDPVPPPTFSLEPPEPRVTQSCDDLRAHVASRTIDHISLDISPAFRPDVINPEKWKEIRSEFDTQQVARDWRSIDGSMIARGKFVELSYQDVVIETDAGGERRIDVSQLSEPDLAFLSATWGLPNECRISQVAYQQREWMPTKMTWAASGLCHNPLYFEEVQLERYGHSLGPISQPVVSSAHFFLNIAVLPYKMGIHPPSECQYALGYYRPGNCAPYLIPPVPLSLRGALAEAGVIATGFAVIP